MALRPFSVMSAFALAAPLLAGSIHPAPAQTPMPPPRPERATPERLTQQRSAEVPIPLERPAPRSRPAAVPPASAPAAAAAATAVTSMPELPLAESGATSALDISAVRRAIKLVRDRKQADAEAVRDTIRDPVGRKVVEWVILRFDQVGADFSRFAEFVVENPNWPSVVTLRRKAESQAYNERPQANAVRRFFSVHPPLSARGKIAQARALAAVGDRQTAHALIRETWRKERMPADMEKIVLDEFGSVITTADHKARMDYRLYQRDDTEAGLRAAKRVGGHAMAIAQARTAMIAGRGSRSLVDKVPAAARHDIGYIFARLQMLRRADRNTEALRLYASLPAKLGDGHDLDEWWKERRIMVRQVLEAGNAKAAYALIRNGHLPDRDVYRAEYHFTAGWIALRFLKDPRTAYDHFSRVPQGQQSPVILSRGYYWMARALEAMGRNNEARSYYQRAALHPTAYYGQIASAKVGNGRLVLQPPPTLTAAQRSRARRLEVVRAASILYAADTPAIVHPFLADLGDKLDDVPALMALADLAAKNDDARGMLLVGRLALSRGLPLDHAAYPTIGLPAFSPIGPRVERALVYAIARQESQFNPLAVSPADAMGLMQVIPTTARAVAKRHKIAYDQRRLLSDPAYNVQIGAAELGRVVESNGGSYILAFVAYNAGPARAREWIGRFGDPRSSKIDPIDWVERIPFPETRNYVQRVMENLQVYRVLFNGAQKLQIEADLRRGTPN